MHVIVPLPFSPKVRGIYDFLIAFLGKKRVWKLGLIRAIMLKRDFSPQQQIVAMLTRETKIILTGLPPSHVYSFPSA